jgi:hypothetical protein
MILFIIEVICLLFFKWLLQIHVRKLK